MRGAIRLVRNPYRVTIDVHGDTVSFTVSARDRPERLAARILEAARTLGLQGGVPYVDGHGRVRVVYRAAGPRGLAILLAAVRAALERGGAGVRERERAGPRIAAG